MHAFATTDDFVDHVLSRFYDDMHTAQEDNYDWGRFSPDDVDRSQVFYTGFHIATLKALLRDSDAFMAAWRLLADESSRQIFIDLLRYRLAGHRHVRLAVNTPAYWDLLRQAAQTATGPSTLAVQGMFGALAHYEFRFERNTLKLDCGVPWPLFLRQYFYEQDGVRVRPEKGDHVIDAGAGFGDTALAFGCAVGGEGCVYSFELLDSHLRVYEHNLAQNAVPARCKMFPCGLSDKIFTPSQPCAETPHYDTGFALTPDNQDYPTTTLDHLVKTGAIQRVDFIKMDIEGSELSALHGAVETLRRFRPRLAISIYHDIAHFHAIPRFLAALDLGYRFHLAHYTIHAGETVLYATADEVATPAS